jgi:hypothetical protein
MRPPIIGQVVGLAMLIAIPCLVILAFRAWASRLRRVLPRWRSVLGVASMLFTFISWLGLIVPSGIYLLTGFNSNFIESPVWEITTLLLIGAEIPLAFALTGSPRVQAVLAALLMALASYTSIVQ